eukprot:6240876-Amphidinium_carterae.1
MIGSVLMAYGEFVSWVLRRCIHVTKNATNYPPTAFFKSCLSFSAYLGILEAHHKVQQVSFKNSCLGSAAPEQADIRYHYYHCSAPNENVVSDGKYENFAACLHLICLLTHGA